MMRSGKKCLFLLFVAFMCVALASPAKATFTAKKTLYVDGVQIGSANAPLGLVYSYNRITLASEGNRWYMYNVLDGAIDEFSIYPGVLSVQDVNDHYTAAQVDQTTYANEVATENPLIYLQFEDATMGDGDVAANNGGSAGTNGTYVSSNISIVSGLFGTDQAASFAGNGAPGCVDVYDGGDRPFSLDDISIEVWVKSTALDTEFPRLFQHNGDYLNELAYGVQTDANNTGIMQVGVIGGSTTDFFDVQAYDINDGNWHQIVVTYDSIFDPCGYPNEITPDNPLVWFKFEEEIAPNVNIVNYGSGDIDANYVGANPIFAPGKVGKGVFLHGFGDDAGDAFAIFSKKYDSGIGDYSHLYAVTPADMSIELWYRCRTQDEYFEGGQLGWARLFSNNGSWETRDSAILYLTAGGYLMTAGSQGEIGDTFMFAQHPGYDLCVPEPNLTGPGDNKWHHVVAVFDVNDTGPNNDPNIDPGILMQLYIDGALRAERNQDPCVPLNITGIMGPEFREMLFGAEASSTGFYNRLRGTMDEVAIYDHVLPTERIVVHYKEGLAAAPWTPETCAQIYLYEWNKAADLNGDCYVNFLDMVATANEWMRCNEPSDGTCEKPWLD